jgi:hypothetical protein
MRLTVFFLMKTQQAAGFIMKKGVTEDQLEARGAKRTIKKEVGLLKHPSGRVDYVTPSSLSQFCTVLIFALHHEAASSTIL